MIGDGAGHVAGVMAQAHRRGASMVRHPLRGELGPGNALHAFHGADREAFEIEDRPLFDVQFDVGMHLRVAARRRPRIADPFQAVPDGLAVDADHGQRLLQRQPADVDQAAHHVGIEARAFLVGEEGHSQRTARHDLRLVERLDDFQAGQHTEVAVEAPAGADRVDVRACHHRRARLDTLAHADHIADRIDRDCKPQFAHPADDPVATSTVFGREREAIHAAPGDRANFPERLDARRQAIRIDAQVMR
jgi:hypothetical protein